MSRQFCRVCGYRLDLEDERPEHPECEGACPGCGREKGYGHYPNCSEMGDEKYHAMKDDGLPSRT